MSTATRPERRAPRTTLSMLATIEVPEEGQPARREMTYLKNASPIGAGFMLKHRIPVGRVVKLTMPLPAELRLTGQFMEQYTVWALVRHCNPLSVVDSSAYHLGVAFIGPDPPRGYPKSPLPAYRLAGINHDGFWTVKEEPTFDKTQRHPRYNVPIDVRVMKINAQKVVLAEEQTVTENISLGGAAVFTTLEFNRGDLVKFVAEQYNASLFAEVRGTRRGKDGIPRVHLRFVGSEFPLAGIEQT